MGLDEIWDKVIDEFDYFIHFEWIGDTLEFFSGLFENIGEFSIMGLIGGIIGVVLTNMVLGKLDYLNEMSGAGRIFTSATFYIFSFILTYIMVRRVFDF